MKQCVTTSAYSHHVAYGNNMEKVNSEVESPVVVRANQNIGLKSPLEKFLERYQKVNGKWVGKRKRLND